jgi:hypothetical protein
LARQHHGTHKKTHDLEILAGQISRSTSGLDLSLLRSMPSANRVIEMRAGEGAAVPQQEAYKMYRTALQLCEQCTAAMPRKLVLKNAALHLQRPPWT